VANSRGLNESRGEAGPEGKSEPKKTMRAKLAYPTVSEILGSATKTPWLQPLRSLLTNLEDGWTFDSWKRTFFISRKRRFSIGLRLALWPVIIVAVFPSSYLAGVHANLFAYNRLPVVVFCTAALTSEAVAALLFFLSYKRRIDGPEDRLTSWSIIAAAAAGACSLAFLIGAVGNAMQVW
jgi:hypothetical protein